MHAAFGTVLVIVCVVSFVVAMLALMWSRRTWEEYGKRGLTFDGEGGGSAEPPPGSPAEDAQRESEIRELLEARNARRARRGEAPVDIDREVSELSGTGPGPTAGAGRPDGDPARPARAPRPNVDPALREEIRELVVARNERRVRAGKPPLDVEREVEREIEALAGQGLMDPHGRGDSG